MDLEKSTSTKATSKKWWIITFLLLSLLIHITCIMLFMQHGFRKRAVSWWQVFTKTIPPQQQKEINRYLQKKREAVAASLAQLAPHTKRDAPAQLRAPKSRFGWVLFDSPVQKASDHIEVPTTLEGDVASALAPLATEETPVPPEYAKKLPQPEHVAEQQHTQSKDLENEHAQHLTGGEARTVEQNATEPQPDQQLSTASEQNIAHKGVFPEPSTVKQIENIKAWQDKIEAFQAQNEHAIALGKGTQHSAAQERMIGGLGGIRVRGARSEIEKPKRNIIALTKGFVEKLDGEDGSDLIDREGDPTKRPSFEELKYLSYEAKLSWCLQSSWKQNFYYRPAAKPLEGKVALQFSINENGELQQCTLVQSSGHKELDDLVMKNMKFASPFPPIPKHFGVTTYTTSRMIYVYGHMHKG